MFDQDIHDVPSPYTFQRRKPSNTAVIVAAVLAFAIVGLFAFAALSFISGVKRAASVPQPSIVERWIAGYEIAVRNNHHTDASALAGLISASYLQANDEENYRKWKDLSGEELAESMNQQMHGTNR